jgi:hypothetical protein
MERKVPTFRGVVVPSSYDQIVSLNYSHNETASHPRRPESTATPLTETRMLQLTEDVYPIQRVYSVQLLTKGRSYDVPFAKQLGCFCTYISSIQKINTITSVSLSTWYNCSFKCVDIFQFFCLSEPYKFVRSCWCLRNILYIRTCYLHSLMHITYVLMICVCISYRLQVTSTVSFDRLRNLVTCPSFTVIPLTVPISILFSSAAVSFVADNILYKDRNSAAMCKTISQF